jgi:hypothetical protein
MARMVIGRTGSWPRRWQVLLSLIISVGVGVVFIVQAVHDLDFELDGNIQRPGHQQRVVRLGRLLRRVGEPRGCPSGRLHCLSFRA